MKLNIRPFHRILSLILVIPLIVTLASGIIYRIGKAWFGMSKQTGDFFMHIHTGEWMGDSVGVYYVLVVGVGLIFLILSGTKLLFKSKGGNGIRRSHRIIGAILILPLLASAVTGVGYMVGEQWFDMPKHMQDLMMTIHEGAWLGKTYKPFYVLFIGLGLLFMALSGLKLSRVWK
ncbi:MAG: PepSY domain-containing protein [Verrucomicrobiota bacterium]|nr:PepSY domain-containing protein [Verrucomicrobiota bacterium]